MLKEYNHLGFASFMMSCQFGCFSFMLFCVGCFHMMNVRQLIDGNLRWANEGNFVNAALSRFVTVLEFSCSAACAHTKFFGLQVGYSR